MNKQKTRGQLISKLQHMKFQPNGNSIQHLNYEDINTICNYLLEDKKEIEELEKEKEHLIDEYAEEYEARKNVEFKLFKMERALDKACEELAKMCHQTKCGNCHFVLEQEDDSNDCPVQGNCCSFDWKEWCMKDVN